MIINHDATTITASWTISIVTPDPLNPSASDAAIPFINADSLARGAFYIGRELRMEHLRREQAQRAETVDELREAFKTPARRGKATNTDMLFDAGPSTTKKKAAPAVSASEMANSYSGPVTRSQSLRAAASDKTGATEPTIRKRKRADNEELEPENIEPASGVRRVKGRKSAVRRRG